MLFVDNFICLFLITGHLLVNGILIFNLTRPDELISGASFRFLLTLIVDASRSSNLMI